MTEPSTFRLADRLRACRPGLAIRSLEYLAEGDFCRAWVLDGHRIVRIPRHAEAARALEREACLLPRIADGLPLAVPVPTYVVCSASDDFSFAVHEQVHGTALTSRAWLGFPEPVRARLARGLGGFLRDLHGLDVAIGRACGLEVVDHRARVESLCRRLREAPGARLPGALRTALVDGFDGHLAGGAESSYEPALLHADVSPGHVLVDADRGELTGVIDWGDAAIGDPARDFIFLYEDWGADFLELALDGYSPAPGAGRMLHRVHLRYLADQLEWTLRAGAAGRPRDLEHGIAALSRAVRDFETSAP